MFGFKMNAFLVGAMLAVVGCIEQGFEQVEEQELPPPEPMLDEQALSDQGEQKVWTSSWTSEEYPPLTCNTGRLVSGADCSSNFCDNVRLNCESVSGLNMGARSWEGYFSEEPTNYRYCPSGAWMTGIACRGDYCDSIAIECTRVTNHSYNECTWSGYFSEEDPAFNLETGKYVRGVQCNGQFCDNKRYYYCTLL